VTSYRRSLPVALDCGWVTRDHAAPSHRRLRARYARPSKKYPTAQQSVEAAHPTPDRITMVPPSGLGEGASAQAVPSQCMARVCCEPEVSYPTAQQSSGATQSRPWRKLWEPSMAFGVATRAQSSAAEAGPAATARARISVIRAPDKGLLSTRLCL
jgi:hypothetical protein